jgi:hypothetical protein
MQLVASVSAALDHTPAAASAAAFAQKTQRPMTTILFTRPNIHRVDRRSAWLKLRGHTQKK